jgi:hypothetical protein
MGNNNSFLNNASSFFDKLMKQTYVKKTQLIQLKRQLKQLAEIEKNHFALIGKNPKKEELSYNKLYNRITNIGDRAKGENSPTILKQTYIDFNTLKNDTIKNELFV